MAFENNQNEPSLPTDGNNDERRSYYHLPKYFRTNFNKKFLNSTLEQMTQPGVVKSLNAFVGRKHARAFDANKDIYLGDVDDNRINYQLEPATVIEDELGNLQFYSDYIDIINHIKILNGDSNQSNINASESYSWDPHIDWDKFTNFREYYWLPNGPETCTVAGQSNKVASTFKINLRDNVDNFTYIFTPDGLTNNPNVTLYRGQTYKFIIDTPNYPIAFVTKISFTPGVEFGDSTTNTSLIYLDGITKYDIDGNEITDNFISEGVIEWTVSDTVPDNLFYISKDDPNLFGAIKIFDIIENSSIDVEKEIIGKSTYTTSDGWALSNGMQIAFAGNVSPTVYADGEWFVEGVGDSIKLINADDLRLNSVFVADKEVAFDNNGFDQMPFGEALGYAEEKDYIVINRASNDGNLWSKYNRWFHKDVIEKSFTLNKQEILLDQESRAKRPIIEFESNIKLFNFGTQIKKNVDLIDTVTTDVFSTIEGALGYNIDGIDITEGLRILFVADTDGLVKNRIFKVKFLTFKNTTQISLIEEDDGIPLDNECVLITKGNNYRGKYFHYTGNAWKQSQDKIGLNQAPLFDLFDYDDVSLNDTVKYSYSQFSGNKLFSYAVGNGANDNELNFPLQYQNIKNSGDIVFNFDLLNQSFTYNNDNTVYSYKTDISYLRRYKNREEYDCINGWVKSRSALQPVFRQFISAGQDIFPLDMYDDNRFIQNLWIRVYIDNKLQSKDNDFIITTDVNQNHYLKFSKIIAKNKSVLIKTRSTFPKNENGFYEIPCNLEKNPLNQNISTFTLGEIIDHVSTIVEESNDFVGTYPGTSNLRDLGNSSQYGKKFLKHSSLYNLYAYHLLDKNANVKKAITFAKVEYSKFKRLFIETASNLGFDGPVKTHFDKIMESINKDKNADMPFAISDMIPTGGAKVNSDIIVDKDQEYFAISEVFDNDVPSYKAVSVYRNGIQLIYKKDYEFNAEGFVRLLGFRKPNDVIDIYEYESTLENFVPPTPTKLGLYPKYIPELYIDTTVQNKSFVDSTLPYKIYGEKILEPNEDNQLGWFYPVYLDYEQAVQKDIENEGTGEFTVNKFNGLSTAFFIPKTHSNKAQQDTNLYTEYENGQVVIQGHDGSLIPAFKDYRDQLLLELEKRIFNNIKISYDENLFDIDLIQQKYYQSNVTPAQSTTTIMFQDFFDWTRLVNVDYAENKFFDRFNAFTYNYSSTYLKNGLSSPGWWRQLYKFLFNTDRPHTHPWEMLGFTIEPKWWKGQYGDKPYTKNNKLMWNDIENGIIRQPTFKIKNKFIRKGLNLVIPVDEHGELLPPTLAGIVSTYDLQSVKRDFKFADGGPVESAWRRSSEYPFSLLKSFVLNRPAYTFSTGFDRNQQVRGKNNQIIYEAITNHLQLDKLVYPGPTQPTSGLINYITEYQNTIFTDLFENYKTSVQNIKNRISFKLGGFTDKRKLKLILDSRTPLNEGNVFVPNENYDIKLITSFPIDEIVYSGVIIEKQENGFYIKGYDSLVPSFTYFKAIPRDADTVINIGGVSESFVVWEPNKTYSQDTIVKVGDNQYYRAKITHRSQDTFDQSRFASLDKLPIIGGSTAFIRKRFEHIPSTLDYGTVFQTHQDVVDFLLGYGQYLQSLGFTFDHFVEDQYDVADWLFSVKQFLFWVTQNWKKGSLITLSPGADKITYTNTKAFVGNTLNSSIGYSVLKADGTYIPKDNLKFYRDFTNIFQINTVNTAAGIYFIRIPLIYKEHAVLIDNTTVFNDVIYDQEPGYRQERIRIAGYKTANWNGSLNIPGFFYDKAEITEWKAWNDYYTGQVVKYKEFYYSAKSKINGSDIFDFNIWKKITDIPESKLYTNFDYHVDQFKDFYDLDSDSLNVEQQKLAQHLIGYQKRKYLENIINNEVSQYKFYQGYIQDKGTKNAFSKLFDVLSSADKDSFEFYEEWGVRTGIYGHYRTYAEFDVVIDESKIKLNPQPVILTNNITGKETDLILRIPDYKIYNKDENFTNDIFPTFLPKSTVFNHAGYVSVNDVNHTLVQYADLLNENIEEYNSNDLIWIGSVGDSWNVYSYVKHDIEIKNIKTIEGSLTSIILELASIPKDLVIGEIIGIENILGRSYTAKDSTAETQFVKSSVKGFFEIIDIFHSQITLSAAEEVVDVVKKETADIFEGFFTVLKSVRIPNLDGLTDVINSFESSIKNKFWVDDIGNGEWRVLQPYSNYEFTKNVVSANNNFTNFSKSVAVNKNNNYMAVGAPDDGDGKVYVYSRPSISNKWTLLKILLPESPIQFQLNTSNLTEFSLDEPTGYSSEDWATRVMNNVQNIQVVYINAIKIDPIEEYEELSADLKIYYEINVAENKIIFNGSDALPNNSTLVIEFAKSLNPKKFGSSVDLSADGRILVVGAPNASNIMTRNKGEYSQDVDYTQGDIVTYNSLTWQALVDINKYEPFTVVDPYFSTVDFLIDNNLIYEDSEQPLIILTGNYPLSYKAQETPVTTTQLLVRVSKDLYEAIESGNSISLYWNKLTNANQTQLELLPTEPFNDQTVFVDNNQLWSEFISKDHAIDFKFQEIVTVDNAAATPEIGQVLSSETALGTVVYLYSLPEASNSFILYLADVAGEFAEQGILSVGITTIGQFVRQTINDNYFEGYIAITTPEYYVYADTDYTAKGLIISEIRTTNNPVKDRIYYNILNDTIYEDKGISGEPSLIRSLSYNGTSISPAGVYSAKTAPLSYFGLRLPKEMSDYSNQGDVCKLQFNKLAKTVSILRVRNTRFSLPPEVFVGETLKQRNNEQASAVVFSNTVKVADDSIDITNPIYEIQIQYYSKNYDGNEFNFLDELIGSISGEIFARPVDNVVENIYTSIQSIGFSTDDLMEGSEQKTIWNLWDGYIIYNENRFAEGLPYLLVAKYEEDGTGNLVVNGSGQGQIIREVGTTNTAEVMYVQRNTNNNVTVYVDNVQGEWSQNDSLLEMLPIANQNDYFGRENIYAAVREFGVSQQVNLANDTLTSVGKLAIFETFGNLPIVISQETGLQQKEIIGEEYWVYTTEQVQGISKLPNIPSNTSVSWQELFSIPVDTTGIPSLYNNEGSVYVFEKFGTNYLHQKTLVSPDSRNNHYFGQQVQVRQNNNIYTGYFLAADETNSETYPGKMYFYKFGEIDGLQYNWDLARNKKYRGPYNESVIYFTNDIVYFENSFYVARTNLQEGISPANNNFWQLINQLIDYSGCIPNNMNDFLVTFDSADISTIPADGMYDFARTFAVSADGEVLIVQVKYNTDITNSIAVYRLQDGFYRWMQNIVAPKANTNFADRLSINDDGSIFVVGLSLDDNNNFDDGSVYVYKLKNQKFELDQTITSPKSVTLQKFGYNVLLHNNILFITAYNGKFTQQTTFDNILTTFDNNFTTFKYTNVNVGEIYVYYNLYDQFIYREKFSYENIDSKVYEIGINFNSSGNSLYVNLPTAKTIESSDIKIGKIVEFRKDVNELWIEYNKPKFVPDLNKIKKILVYNKKNNEFLYNLDYIDPLQGKIPGSADQNITYKSYYDPAVYTVGTNNQVVDTGASWGTEYIGKIWWDLTNVRYYYPYINDITYSALNWGRLWPNSTIDIYEWVGSNFLPAEWDALQGTSEGFSLNITGQTKYGNASYSTQRVYDTTSQSYVLRYFYWVKNKTSIPSIDGRNLSADKISNLLGNTLTQGYKFISLISANEFSLYNLQNDFVNDEVAVSFQTYDEVTDLNTHYQYKLLTSGLATSQPNEQLNQKWIDSLVGYDLYGRNVPDPSLSEKYRYGNLDTPRQGWFRNKQEALKQYVEHVNQDLAKELLVDNKNLQNFYRVDDPPLLTSNFYDIEVESKSDLDSYGVAKAVQAEISLQIENGHIIDVFVLNAGRGYITTPTYAVIGKGEGLELEFIMTSNGSIGSVNIINQGKNYSDSTYIIIRKFTALVAADETIFGKWALYERDYNNNSWIRIQSQGFNTTLYWYFIDWYAAGYNEATKVTHSIDYSYELSSVDDNIGDIVRIRNIGDGSWLLLEKINSLANVDYSVNYKTIGRNNGTIQLSRSLYDPTFATTNFDTISFDTYFYDNIPSIEIRIIANAIKDDIFIDDLAIKYNNLFFSCLRYILSEQPSVDWIFKTNFLKIKHNVGELRQDVTFNNDNLSSYEDYVNEIKPFKAKIREFLSAYDKIEDVASYISDFDLPPRYIETENKILPYKITTNNLGFYNAEQIQNYPDIGWLNNCTYQVVSVEVVDGGAGYGIPPSIEFESSTGAGAVAVAHLGANGSITRVDIINPGYGYLSAPRIVINGSFADGYSAKLAVVIGNPIIRSLQTNLKYDRISTTFAFSDLDTVETFIGSGSKYIFNLQWPISINKNTINVTVDGKDLLTTDYTYTNYLDKSKSYNRYLGQITLLNPAPNFTTIQVSYKKDTNLLNAADRINLLYTPYVGQFGNDISQLMDGVDYGGVEVKGFDFGNQSGWDTANYTEAAYDTYDINYEDVLYTVPNNLLLITVTGFNYKVAINYINFAKEVNKLVKGDPTVADIFLEIFNKNSVGEPLADPLDGSSILNVLDEVIDIVDEEGISDAVPRVTFNSANEIQKYGLGNSESETASNNIENQIIPLFNQCTAGQITELISAKILDELYIDFRYPLENGIIYNIYHNNLRIDDINYNDENISNTNPNAVTNSITGDGVLNGILVRDLNIQPEVGDKIIIRKITSDGSFIPTDLDFDALVGGGKLNYSNALGVNAEDIIIDGDNFITPLTSKGPEEQVPGLVQDSVNIKVYERPTPGISNIVSLNYIADGQQNSFSLLEYPISVDSVIVNVDNKIKTVAVDYNVNVEGKLIEFTNTLPQNSRINILILGSSGSNILDTDNIVADGTLGSYITNARWVDNVSSYVTVNGQHLDYVLKKTDSELYDSSNNVLIKFANPVSEGSIIHYKIFENSQNNFSNVHIDNFVADGSSTAFELTKIPKQQEPVEWYTMVIVNDKLLNPGYVETFVCTDVLEYQLKLYQVPISTVSFKQLRVFLNTVELNYLTQWTFTAAESIDPTLPDDQQSGSTIVLKRGIFSAGDTLRVYINAYEDSVDSGGDYRYGYFDQGDFISTPGQLHIHTPLSNGDNIKVYQFTNHDTQSIDWQSFDVIERTKLLPGVSDRYATVIVGNTNIIELPFEMNANAQYAIYKNNVRIDDENFATPYQSNPLAVIQTPFGLGSNIIDLGLLGITSNEDDVIVFEEIGRQLEIGETAENYYELRFLRNGIVPLNQPAIDDQYVWVAVNGVILQSSIDYKLSDNKLQVILTDPVNDNDNIQTIHFSDTRFKNTFGWSQFKDIMNKNHYTVLNGQLNIKLANDLNWYDKTIEITNGEGLPSPNEQSKYPGVIFIAGERIEYWKRYGNTLTHLRRGTLGTGVKHLYNKGIEVYDQSVSSILPYKDETIITKFTADGQNKEFVLDFTPASVNEFEVFVAGRRLRKTELESYQNNQSMDSPESDVTLPAEFSLDENILQLEFVPAKGQIINVIRRIGKTWTDKGVPLSETDNRIVKKIQSVVADLPR